MNGFTRNFKNLMLLAILGFVIIFSSCTGNKNGNMNPEAANMAKEGGVLNLAAYSPDTLNPLCTQYSCIRDYLYLVYEGLFVVNEDLSTKGVLAKDYKASKQNTVFTINLKKGVKFHDGTSFTSDDVIDTLNYISSYDTRYGDVLENVQSYSADTDYSVKITLKSPQANFPANLDFPILSSGLDSEDFTLPNTTYKINGTGRYKYKKTNNYVSMIFEKNTKWHSNAKVYIPEVCIRFVNDNNAIAYAFDSGETDMVTTESGRWGEFSYTVKHKAYEITTTKYVFVGFNTQNSVFSDAELRRNVASLVDKKTVISSVMFSHASVADTPISSKAFFYRNDGEGGEKSKNDNITDKKLSTYILYNEESRRKEEVARYLKGVLEDAGVKVELTKVDFETYIEKIKSGDYQIYVGEVDMKRDNNLRFMFKTSPAVSVPGGVDVVVPIEDDAFDSYEQSDFDDSYISSNVIISNYTSPNLDDIIDNINSSKDDETLKVAYNNLRIFFLENAPQIPLFHVNDALLVSTRIKGTIKPNLTNFYADLGEIYIKAKK